MDKVIDGEGVLLDEIARKSCIGSEPIKFKGVMTIARPVMPEEAPGVDFFDNAPRPKLIYNGDIALIFRNHYSEGIDAYEIVQKRENFLNLLFTTRGPWRFERKERTPGGEVNMPYIAAPIAGYGEGAEIRLRVSKD